MHYQVLAVSALAALTAALPASSPSNPLVARADCPANTWCADCYSSDGCGSDATTLGLQPKTINVGDVNLDDIGNVIADQCFVNPNTQVGSCNGGGIDIPTKLEDGNDGHVTVTITSTDFEGYSKNLLVASVKAALAGSAQKNTVSVTDPATAETYDITTSTVPPGFQIALLSSPDKTITLGMAVTEDPQGDSVCGDLATIGGSIAAVSGPYGAPIGAAISIASLFCE